MVIGGNFNLNQVTMYVTERENNYKQLSGLNKNELIEYISKIKTKEEFKISDEECINLAQAYYFLHRRTQYRNDLEDAKLYLLKVNLSRLEKNQAGMGFFLAIEGMVYQGFSESGALHEEAKIALQKYEASLRIFTHLYNSVPSSDLKQKFNQWMAYQNNSIGNVYIYLLADPETGSEYVKKAIEIEKKMYGVVRTRQFIWNLRDAHVKANQKDKIKEMFKNEYQAYVEFFFNKDPFTAKLKKCYELHFENLEWVISDGDKSLCGL